jgi:hypothetical protein
MHISPAHSSHIGLTTAGYKSHFDPKRERRVSLDLRQIDTDDYDCGLFLPKASLSGAYMTYGKETNTSA